MEIHTAEELDRLNKKKEKRRKMIKFICFVLPLIIIAVLSHNLWLPELPWNQYRAKKAAESYVQNEYGSGFIWYNTTTCVDDTWALIGCYNVYFHTPKYGDMYVCIDSDMAAMFDDFYDMGDAAVKEELFGRLKKILKNECKDHIKCDITGFDFHECIDIRWAKDIYAKELSDDALLDEMLKNEGLFNVIIKMKNKPDKANINTDADAIFHITKYLTGKGLPPFGEEQHSPKAVIPSPDNGTYYIVPDIDYLKVSDEEGIKAVKEWLEEKFFCR